MAKSKLTACLAAGALALGASLPALADGGEFVFVVDRAGITGDRSAQEIYAELVVTAGEYCTQFGDAQQTCVAEMVQLAIDEVADESLTAIHARVTAHQDGVMTASYSD
ncbi:MAG: hypothetical protein CMF74_16110 [Maricaulis sp.]|jgi:hypothetical protein|nr:hypothetical protein [Maricaulis sp.]